MKLSAEDALRAWIIENSPEIRRDIQTMTEQLRELVKVEREKAGLDKPSGSLELWRNNAKKGAGDPDLVGVGHVAGRFYRLAGWFSKTGNLKIGLLPRRRK